MSSETLENLLREERRFPPDPGFAAQAVARPELYDEAAEDRLQFWNRQARALRWHTPCTRRSTGRAPFAKWFVDGTLNVAYNCVDRHVDAGHGDRVAFHLEGEPGDTRDDHLRRAARRGAAGPPTRCTTLGVGTGDRVAIYMPMIPEAVDRDAGRAPASARRTRWCSAGSRAEAPARRDRRRRGEARHHRRRRLPARARRRRSSRPSTRRSPARRRRSSTCSSSAQRATTSRGTTAATSGGTTSIAAAADRARAREAFDSRAPAVHPLHVRHDRQAEGHPAHHRRLPHPGRLHAPSRLRPAPRDRRLLVHRRHRLGHRSQLRRLRPARQRRDAGACTRARPTPRTRAAGGRSSQKYGVTILYTAPTAIRSFMKWGDEIPAQFDLSSLRVLGTRGRADQPRGVDLVPRASSAATGRPIVDTWWQTETGAIMITPLPGRDRDQARARAQCRCPGISIDVVDDEGHAGRQRRRRLPRASPSRGRRCCAASGATRERYQRDVLVEVPDGLLLRRRRRQAATTTATSGCSAGSTTS